MKDMETIEEAEITLILRRSKVRRIVLAFLVNTYPKYSYASEISRQTHLRLNEVCGALKGSPKRYRKENSLLEFGLVERIKKKNVFFYRSTKKAKDIWKLF